jgi:hypothetical protein
MRTYTPPLTTLIKVPARARPAPKPAIAPLSTPALQRKRGCACGGSCPRCQAEQALHTGLQTKLKISEPGDRYEREADRVASQVIGMPAPAIAPMAEAETPLQRKSASAAPAMPGALSSLQGSGQPLNTATRTFFEPRFGNDLSQVRIHTAPQAQAMASEVQARAFTVGSNIVFGAGQYHPGTSAGQQLLAHELTHVLQQTGGNAVEDPPLQRQILPVSQRFPQGGLQRQTNMPMGGNACLNRCEEEFRYCLEHRPMTQTYERCLARRQSCMRGCPPVTPPTSGFP